MYIRSRHIYKNARIEFADITMFIRYNDKTIENRTKNAKQVATG